MMESLVGALDDWGVPAARIHYEAFGPASVKRRTVDAEATPAEGAGEIMVSFARSGQQLMWNPEAGSLLEFAEAHGVAVESGCRAGSCGSCQTTIRAGEVAYRHAPDFDPEPGCCLLCVSTPKTNLVLEA
jgi:ferredoxin